MNLENMLSKRSHPQMLIVCDSIYMKCPELAIYRDRKCISVCEGQGVEINRNIVNEIFLKLDNCDGLQLCEYTSTHKHYTFKRGDFLLCEFYLN